jgi:hypothetical protein
LAPPGQVPTEAGGPHQDDLGLEGIDEMTDSLQIRLGAVKTEDRRINEVGLICSIGEGIMAEKLDPCADHNSGKRYLERIGQLPPFAEQFPGDLGGLPFGLLKDPHPR